MFAGLLRRENHRNYDDTDSGCGAKEHRRCSTGMEGCSVIACPSVSAGSANCKRLAQRRRPGYLRTESPPLQRSQAGEEGRTACLTNGASQGALENGHNDVIKSGSCDSVNPLRHFLEKHGPEPVSPLQTSLEKHGPEPVSPLQTSPEKHGPEPGTYVPKGQSHSSAPLLLSLSPPLSQEECCCGTNCSSSSLWTTPPCDPRLTPESGSCLHQPRPFRSSSKDMPFSSSFSFIQQSLNSCLDPDLCSDPEPKPLNRCPVHVDPKPQNISSVLYQSSALTSKPISSSWSVSLSQSPQSDQSPSTSGSRNIQSRLGVLELSFGLSVSKLSTPSSIQPQISSMSLNQSKSIPINQSEIRSIPINEEDRRPRVWQDQHWEPVGFGVKLSHSATSDLAEVEPNCELFSLDTEAASSQSLGEDSDAASGSSLTSGYESATPTAVTNGLVLDHTHEHTHDHAHDHTHDHTHDLTHDYTLDHTHDHTLDHTHEHMLDNTHDHTLDHSHDHTHDQTLDHTHGHTHDYTLDHTDGPAQNHTMEHTRGPAQDHTHDHTLDHTQDREQGFWDQLVKKYDGILQDCLCNTQTNTKIESMMLKPQRLQGVNHVSVEQFDKTLEELGRERRPLRLVLSSRMPGIGLGEAVYTSLNRTGDHRGEVEHDGGGEANALQGPQQRREQLLQEKHQVEEEMTELQKRLGELQSRNRSLEFLIQYENVDVEAEVVEGPALEAPALEGPALEAPALEAPALEAPALEAPALEAPALEGPALEAPALEGPALEGPALHSCSHALHRVKGRALNDMMTSQNRTRISVFPPAAIRRLQEEQQALSLSIKDATAKVVLSQSLSGSLRRKVCETETHLLALHEAKQAADSGKDLSSAKELKAEMGVVYRERELLELLLKRLHSLSSVNNRDLGRMKTQYTLLKQELSSRQAQHERHLKKNAVWYLKLLEDKLDSCGVPPLEEDDLDACHLDRGIELRTPSCSGLDPEEPSSQADLVEPPRDQPTTKAESELHECAMLTALGGHWCPEANLQDSEFTKKLGEFLFCMEDVHFEEEFSSESTDLPFLLTDQCEMISDRLVNLEVDLQTAIQSRDHSLTQSLEREVQEVKATLHMMLVQLHNTEEEEHTRNIMHIEKQEDEEEQYFSDSWEI